MNFWDHLFDNDTRQREDIEALSARSSERTIEASALRRQIRALERRVDRNELLNEALFRWLEAEHELTSARFRELVVQIDLEDGVEDGRVGADKTARAPKCGACARPASRKRTHCVYCDAPLPNAQQPKHKGPYR